MSKFLKINSADNNDGNDMFNAICENILKKRVVDVRDNLGLPLNHRVTTKDLIMLIQEKKLSCEIIVRYEAEEDDKKKVDLEEDPLPFN